MRKIPSGHDPQRLQKIVNFGKTIVQCYCDCKLNGERDFNASKWLADRS